ncbi:MAG: carbonic anhydrase [Alphaproteobacteria bacterium]
MSNNDLQTLLSNNKEWVKKQLKKDGKFFDKLSSKNEPKYLWIGCSDARVPANSIVGLDAGEVFVHRNVGNVVSSSDNNITAVICYAVEALGVTDIIVTGHYGCGAVKASLGETLKPELENWITNIRNVAKDNDSHLSPLNQQQKENTLCELNVKQQVKNVAGTSTLINAWKDGKDISIHGWIYDIHDGLIQDLDCSIHNLEEAQKLND